MRKVLLVGLALLLSACSTSPGHIVESVAGSAAPVSTRPAPTSSSPPFAPEDLAEYAPAEDALKPLGLAQFGEPVPWVISAAPMQLVNKCGRQLQAWDSHVRAGERVSWSNGGPTIEDHTLLSAEQRIGRYEGISGAQVIEDVRKALPCTSATPENTPFGIVEEFSLPKVAEAQYGFCDDAEGLPGAGECVLLLAHGDRATSIHTNLYPHNPDTARELLQKAAPIFAAALSKP
ncbi:hypothetical protein [Amycolatopsis sp. FDAARGOS 1241]|uniref:hypothetical protein n=1 Tax=Amycolatopsis sp. FDAARGOS 1241 TaxID=2778070 RepID=UPI00194EB180|nr:hypothetical protein [Amycolatopsis sp. FDAARGOS 1241]QRP43036.1 hypothetical protein I6J71_26790 [Amycolatopsis sp. FDAARGOS 1241]